MNRTFYITFLRALAAIIITNSHYGSIYPNGLNLIANGGLLGDVIFFAVSGYCLCNVKLSFSRWYPKRIIRIYPSVIIITFIYGFFKLYDIPLSEIFWWFIYPTYYHFIASIIVLYIPFYFIIKVKWTRNHIPLIIVGVLLIQLIIYLFIYDRYYYHIDVVREPIIRFLFFISMLIGAFFYLKQDRYSNQNKVINWIMMIFLAGCYFITKISFVKYDAISDFQILNQYTLLLLLFFVLRSFSGIDKKLNRIPEKGKNIVEFLAKITLEIYLVQYVIIDCFADFVFPFNWLIVTLLILISAWTLHIVSKRVINLIENKVYKKLFHL